jgi:hypothetical protein
MLLRFSPDDAGRQRADRNQDVLQEAQLPTSIPAPNSPPLPESLHCYHWAKPNEVKSIHALIRRSNLLTCQSGSPWEAEKWALPAQLREPF